MSLTKTAGEMQHRSVHDLSCRFLHVLLLATVALTPSRRTTEAEEAARVSRDLVSSIGSEAATNGGGGKVVSFGNKIHVVWQDSTKEGYFNCVRSFDCESEEW